ncbi:MAG: amino acid adenylation domain-containing protein [Desulfobacterales bacterium]|nr:amino acid adenylation domain-containing protein [Desulfobacterales bacterium]
MSDKNKPGFSFFDVQQSAKDESYWLDILSGELPETTLPSDLDGSEHRQMKESDFIIPSELSDQLVKLSKNSDLSLYLIILTAVKCLLYRYTGEEDAIIGSPVHKTLATENTANNLVLIRSTINGEHTFKNTLLQVKDRTVGAYEHQNYLFSNITDSLNLTGEKRKLPRIICLNQSIHDQNSLDNTDFDLLLSFGNHDSVLKCRTFYNSSCFSDLLISQFSDHFINLLASAANDIDVEISKINILNKAETERFVYEFNDTLVEYSSHDSVVSMFEQQAAEIPDAVALVYKDKKLTYRELNERANQVGHYLGNTYDIKPDDLVGILMDRSEQMIISILGILKSGGAYVPIDSNYPSERINYILNNCNCKVLLTDSDSDSQFQVSSSVNTRDIPAGDISNPALQTSEKNLVYVIYTSGSTGNPKGCQLELGNLMNYISWTNSYYYQGKDCGNFGLYTSLSFDLTVTSIFSPLTRGKMLHIYPDDAEIVEILRHSFSPDTPIDCIKITPAHISVLRELELSHSNIQFAIVGGEQLTFRHIEVLRAVNENMEIFNEYGPTEATVGCIVKKVEPNDSKVLIGTPIANMSAYLLDAFGNLVPMGGVGELYVGGKSVGRGYFNNPELTQKKFIPNPFEKGGRLYMTGDLGRWMRDGDMEYLGRNDDQIKIRGYRVELGEIENRLLQHPDIKETAVIATNPTGTDTELIAYIVSDKDKNVSQLRNDLADYLPDHMIPAYFMILDALPLTINGKIDKKALPSPDSSGSRSGISTDYVQPRNPLEEKLAEIWESVLEREKIGINDNFFDLGGHSIKATKLASRIHKQLKAEIRLREIFESPTVAGLAEIVEGKESSTLTEITQIPEAEHYELSHAQRNLWLTDQLQESSYVFNVPDAFMLKGNLDIPAFKKAFQTVVDRHEALRTTFIPVSGQPRQKIHPNMKFEIEESDLTWHPDPEILAKEFAGKEITTPFDLSEGPLLRAKLLKTQENKYVFLLTMHHIISDAWSMEVLVKEVSALYKAYSAGKDNPLQPLKIQYKDYAAWQNKWLEQGGGNEPGKYWQKKLAGPLPVLNFPTDYPRPAVKSYNGDTVIFVLDKDITAALNKLAGENNASLYMVLVSAVKALLYRYSAQEDIIIGTLIAGRTHSDLDDQIGFYVNMLPLRTKVKGDDSFTALVRKLKQTTSEAYDFQLYPIDRLVEELGLKRDISRNPVFDIGIGLQEEIQAEGLDGLDITLFEDKTVVSKFDMDFLLKEKDDYIELRLEYVTDLFKRETILKFLDHFKILTEQVIENPGIKISEIELVKTIEPVEEEEVSTRFNF